MNKLAVMDIRALDRARVSRDARFDGKFFIAVTSTGIYCRPICPVRSPKRSNIRYYGTAAEAAEAGFRPCLRCRPEAAPGTPAWRGTSTVVKRALRLIEDGVLDRYSVEILADKVGIGPRHLHRLFAQHVGASPLSLAQTRRLHFAKRLLDETALPVKEIAIAAGFGSVRRFNSEFRRIYDRAPLELRKQPRTASSRQAHDSTNMKMAFRPPYDFDGVLRFLAARAVPGVEKVDHLGYWRTIATSSGSAIVNINSVEGENALQLRVFGALPEDLFRISSIARRMFDVAADPGPIVDTFRGDELLAPLIRVNPGLRIPGTWDAFECAVRTIPGQQVSVETERTLAADLVERFGKTIDRPANGLTHIFPSAETLAAADIHELRLTNRYISTIQALAKSVVSKKIDFSAPADEVVRALTHVEGVGMWTAQNVALRALAEPDAFPAVDLALRRQAGKNEPLSVRQMEARSEAWRPWRAYATMCLWQAAQTSRSLLSESQSSKKLRLQRKKRAG